jgi:hypothetical protein
LIGVSLIVVSLIGVSLIVSCIDVPCKGYFRQSNVVCRVGGFTTNSKPIVTISASHSTIHQNGNQLTTRSFCQGLRELDARHLCMGGFLKMVGPIHISHMFTIAPFSSVVMHDQLSQAIYT